MRFLKFNLDENKFRGIKAFSELNQEMLEKYVKKYRRDYNKEAKEKGWDKISLEKAISQINEEIIKNISLAFGDKDQQIRVLSSEIKEKKQECSRKAEEIMHLNEALGYTKEFKEELFRKWEGPKNIRERLHYKHRQDEAATFLVLPRFKELSKREKYVIKKLCADPIFYALWFDFKLSYIQILSFLECFPREKIVDYEKVSKLDRCTKFFFDMIFSDQRQMQHIHEMAVTYYESYDESYDSLRRGYGYER